MCSPPRRLPRAPPPPPRGPRRRRAPRRPRRAARDVSLEVRPGEIFAPRPERRGQSTSSRSSPGCSPDAGRFLLDGREIAAGARRLRRRRGSCSRSRGSTASSPPRRTSGLGAALHRVPRALARERSTLLEEAGLADRAREPVERLSGGMRRRLELARAPHPRAPSPRHGRAHERARRRRVPRLLGRDRRAPAHAGARRSSLTTHRPDEAERCDRLAVLAAARSSPATRPRRSARAWRETSSSSRRTTSTRSRRDRAPPRHPRARPPGRRPRGARGGAHARAAHRRGVPRRPPAQRLAQTAHARGRVPRDHRRGAGGEAGGRTANRPRPDPATARASSRAAKTREAGHPA